MVPDELDEVDREMFQNWHCRALFVTHDPKQDKNRVVDELIMLVLHVSIAMFEASLFQKLHVLLL